MVISKVSKCKIGYKVQEPSSPQKKNKTLDTLKFQGFLF